MFGRKKPGAELLPFLVEAASAYYTGLNNLHERGVLDDNDWMEGLVVFGYFCLSVAASDGKISKSELELLAAFYRSLGLSDDNQVTLVKASSEYRLPIDGSPLYFDKSIDWDRRNGGRVSEFMVRGLVNAMVGFGNADGKMDKKEMAQAIKLLDPLQRARMRGGLPAVDF